MAGKKKRKYKKVYKGVRYINNVLKKQYPKKYANTKERQALASELFNVFKETKQKVNVKNIKNLIKEKRQGGKKPTAPLLDEGLSAPTNYFNLIDYPLFISRMAQTPEVYFESKIIPKGLPDLAGGYDYDYTDYFRPFVKFIDTLRGLDTNTTRYQNQYYVVCTEPIFNKDKKIWISEIISCDDEGIEQRYGFNADDIESLPTEEWNEKNQPISPPTAKPEKPTEQPKPEKPKEPKAPTTESESETKIKLQIDLEKQKQKTVLLELIRDSKDADERKLFMNMLKSL